MTHKLPSMFGSFRPSCKADARCRQLPAPRVVRTVNEGDDLAIFFLLDFEFGD
jgi:hypothetical protein